MKFVDVSHWQGNIDWSNVANDGVEGTYIKATEGSEAGDAFVDNKMDYNFKQAAKNGLYAGLYHYAKFINENDAIEEADWFIKNIQGYDFTLPPMLDLEENNCSSDAEMNKAAKAFLQHVEKELGSAGLYSFGNFYRDHVDKSLSKRYVYWHARYASEPINEKLDDIFLWQYSSKGNVAGITENVVDLNETGGKFFAFENGKKVKKGTKKATSKKKMTSSTITGSTYKVQSGDTLSGIASDTGVSVDNLVKWNNIKDKNVIQPGDVLNLKAPKENTSNYKVQSGDTLSGIANKFGTSVAKLKELNGLSGDTIYVGDTIQVTGSTKSTKKYHTVQSGDTVSQLAADNNVTQSQIKNWNGLADANSIQIGQKLRVK